MLFNHVDFNAPFTPLIEDQVKKSVGLRALHALALYVVDGILRVGGRWRSTPISDAAKHPILLPTRHPVTKVIVFMYHVKTGLMRVSHTLSLLNADYWFLKEKSAVETVS